MGLYINDRNHMNMYKNRDELQGQNQALFVQNHVSEMVKEQKRINDSLAHTLLGIRSLYEQQHYESENKWTQIEAKLKELREFNTHHEVMENQVASYLQQLEKDNGKIRELIEADQLSEQEVREQLSEVNSSYQAIANQLAEVSKANEQLALKIDNQTDFQEHLSEQLSVQGESNEKIEKRLDNQEALTEKVVRQLDHFRSILFERTNYLSDKIEEASTYIMDLLADRDQIQTNFLLYENQKKREKNK